MCIQAHPRKCFVVFVSYTMQAILENWKCYNLSHFNFDIICHFRIWCSVKFLTNWATGQTAGKLFATYLKVYHVTWFKLFFSHFRYLSKIWWHGPGYGQLYVIIGLPPGLGAPIASTTGFNLDVNFYYIYMIIEILDRLW